MELKDILNQRLDILEENHVICKKKLQIIPEKQWNGSWKKILMQRRIGQQCSSPIWPWPDRGS